MNVDEMPDRMPNDEPAPVPPPDPAPKPIDPIIKWSGIVLALATFAVWAYATLTGQTTAPPPPLPQFPAVQSAPAIPPGHTATIQTDAAGKVSMFVAPNQ